MEAKIFKSNKNLAIIYPWLNLYGGGEVFLEYCNNILIKNFKTYLYYYNSSKKKNKKLQFDKKTIFFPVKSNNKIIHFFCSKYMIFAQAYLIFFFNKYNKKKFDYVFSAAGEFFSKYKTIQYIHICIFSLNIFEYKNFGLNSSLKKILRFFAALSCRFILGINKNKFYKVITLTNSKWSMSRLSKTYNIKNKKVLYPTFKIPKFENNNLKKFNKKKNIFIVLGRVSKDKRILDVIKFFNLIKKEINNSELHIVGPVDKKYFNTIKDKIYGKKEIFIHGLVNLQRRDKILKEGKYGLNFFYSEHFGRATLEMQKLGMIVFARDNGGVKEILPHMLQRYKNYTQLKNNILRIHNNDKIKENILKKNKNVFKYNFTDKKFKNEFLNNFKLI